MTNPFHRFLEEQGVVVLDGGLATELEERGHTIDSALWSARLLLDDPDAIRDVHLAYLEAGADCITSASYQASFEGFTASGLTDVEIERVLRRSSEIALDARDEFLSRSDELAGRLPPLVAASVGPYGAYLADGSEYNGRYRVGVAALDDFHRRRFGLLASSGVDLLACETIPRIDEIEVLFGILSDHPETWVWVSVSCRDGERLSDGSSFESAVRLCSGQERIAGVGVNCTAPRHMVALMTRAAAITELPVIAYPNAGDTYDTMTKRWTGRATADAWLRAVHGSLAAGARVVGGCCRVGPGMIQELRRNMEGGDSKPDDSVEDGNVADYPSKG